MGQIKKKSVTSIMGQMEYYFCKMSAKKEVRQTIWNYFLLCWFNTTKIMLVNQNDHSTLSSIHWLFQFMAASWVCDIVSIWVISNHLYQKIVYSNRLH